MVIIISDDKPDYEMLNIDDEHSILSGDLEKVYTIQCKLETVIDMLSQSNKIH